MRSCSAPTTSSSFWVKLCPLRALYSRTLRSGHMEAGVEV